MENLRRFANWLRQFAWLGHDGGAPAAALAVVRYALKRGRSHRAPAGVHEGRLRSVPVALNGKR